MTLTDVLYAGLAWLYDTPQPADAILSHHGATAPAVGNRRLRFIPSGAGDRPVIVLDVARWTWNDHGDPSDVLTVAEFDRLTAAIRDHGHKVADTWNGPGRVTGSIGLARPAHPSLLDAVNRYRDGCQAHPDPFCHRADPPCTWHRDGHARVARPDWQATR